MKNFNITVYANTKNILDSFIVHTTEQWQAYIIALNYWGGYDVWIEVDEIK